MSRFCVVFVTAIALISTAGVARAQEPSQLDEAARLTFQSAREAFVAGDYERALGLFRQAYNLSQRPGLLYNIAQTLDRLRRDAETLQALRDYLEAYPDAPNRPEVEARVRVLQGSVDEDEQRRAAEESRRQQAAAAAAAAGQPVAPPPDEGGIGILHPAIFISVGGVALVAAGLAVWSGLETISLNDTYTANTDPATVGMDFNDAESMQLLANVFIFSSAGLAVVAAVFGVLTDWSAFDGGADSSAATVRPSLALSPFGASAGLEGSF